MNDPIEQERGQTEPVIAVESKPVPVPPPPPHKPATQRVQDSARNLYRIVRMVVLAALGFIVALFVLRNWDNVEMDFVFGSADLPLALVMLLFTVIGIAVGMLLYWFIFRKDHDSHRN
jgi:uncharacterized integral membrane protein